MQGRVLCKNLSQKAPRLVLLQHVRDHSFVTKQYKTSESTWQTFAGGHTAWARAVRLEMIELLEMSMLINRFPAESDTEVSCNTTVFLSSPWPSWLHRWLWNVSKLLSLLFEEYSMGFPLYRSWWPPLSMPEELCRSRSAFSLIKILIDKRHGHMTGEFQINWTCCCRPLCNNVSSSFTGWENPAFSVDSDFSCENVTTLMTTIAHHKDDQSRTWWSRSETRLLPTCHAFALFNDPEVNQCPSVRNVSNGAFTRCHSIVQLDITRFFWLASLCFSVDKHVSSQ